MFDRRSELISRASDLFDEGDRDRAQKIANEIGAVLNLLQGDRSLVLYISDLRGLLLAHPEGRAEMTPEISRGKVRGLPPAKVARVATQGYWDGLLERNEKLANALGITGEGFEPGVAHGIIEAQSTREIYSSNRAKKPFCVQTSAVRIERIDQESLAVELKIRKNLQGSAASDRGRWSENAFAELQIFDAKDGTVCGTFRTGLRLDIRALNASPECEASGQGKGMPNLSFMPRALSAWVVRDPLFRDQIRPLVDTLVAKEGVPEHEITPTVHLGRFSVSAEVLGHFLSALPLKQDLARLMSPEFLPNLRASWERGLTFGDFHYFASDLGLIRAGGFSGRSRS